MCIALLYDMRQLVREKMSASRSRWRVLASSEDDLVSGGVSQCVDRARGLGGFVIGVNTHAAEVVAKTSFHESASA